MRFVERTSVATRLFDARTAGFQSWFRALHRTCVLCKRVHGQHFSPEFAPEFAPPVAITARVAGARPATSSRATAATCCRRIRDSRNCESPEDAWRDRTGRKDVGVRLSRHKCARHNCESPTHCWKGSHRSARYGAPRGGCALRAASRAGRGLLGLVGALGAPTRSALDVKYPGCLRSTERVMGSAGAA